MQKYFYFILICILSSCYPAQLYRFEPHGTPNVFVENDKKVAYQREDSVIVSATSISYRDGVYTLEAVIDNQSGHEVKFVPQNTYLFRYSNDTALEENRIYYASSQQQTLNSIDDDLKYESDKLVGKALFSIFLGAAFVAADIASISNDNIASAMPAIAVTHDFVQIALDVSRVNNYEKISQLEGQRQEILDQNSLDIAIKPHHYSYFTLKFAVPYSNYYRIYFEVDERIYNFTFHSNNKFDS